MRRARGRIIRRQLIPLPLGVVTAYFEEPRNLQRLTPPWLGFSILDTPSGPVETGSTIRYRLRLFGIPVGWLTLIERSHPGWGFVDTQIEGPYASWVHTHLFSERDGGVLMEDRVDYELPFGPLGLLALPVIRLQLRAIFRYRRRTVERLDLP
jgi:ligand-binding SRPBCC domain-containing protein